VTCKVQQKGKKVKVTCTVKASASAAAARVRWRLSHAGQILRHGTARAGNVQLDLAGLRPGRYTLTLVTGTGAHRVVRRESVILR
jgi:hypothetical protein